MDFWRFGLAQLEPGQKTQGKLSLNCDSSSELIYNKLINMILWCRQLAT